MEKIGHIITEIITNGIILRKRICNNNYNNWNNFNNEKNRYVCDPRIIMHHNVEAMQSTTVKFY